MLSGALLLKMRRLPARAAKGFADSRLESSTFAGGPPARMIPTQGIWDSDSEVAARAHVQMVFTVNTFMIAYLLSLAPILMCHTPNLTSRIIAAKTIFCMGAFIAFLPSRSSLGGNVVAMTR